MLGRSCVLGTSGISPAMAQLAIALHFTLGAMRVGPLTIRKESQCLMGISHQGAYRQSLVSWGNVGRRDRRVCSDTQWSLLFLPTLLRGLEKNDYKQGCVHASTSSC